MSPTYKTAAWEHSGGRYGNKEAGGRRVHLHYLQTQQKKGRWGLAAAKLRECDDHEAKRESGDDGRWRSPPVEEHHWGAERRGGGERRTNNRLYHKARLATVKGGTRRNGGAAERNNSVHIVSPAQVWCFDHFSWWGFGRTKCRRVVAAEWLRWLNGRSDWVIAASWRK